MSVHMFNKHKAFNWNWSWSIFRCNSRTCLRVLGQLNVSSELMINCKLKPDNFWSYIKDPTLSQAVSIFDFYTANTTFPRHSLYFFLKPGLFQYFRPWINPHLTVRCPIPSSFGYMLSTSCEFWRFLCDKRVNMVLSEVM
jgi:hypothetical protein